VSVDTGLIEG
jgi:hypothetical protein